MKASVLVVTLIFYRLTVHLHTAHSCQSRVFSCQTPGPQTEHLDCICSKAPLPSSIQNLHEQTNQFSNRNISTISLTQCSAQHYTIKLQFGEEQQDTLINYSFSDFVSGKIIFNGEIRKAISVHIEDVVGVLSLKGSLICSDNMLEKPSLEITLSKVKLVRVSNFYVKRSENLCNVTFNVKDSQDFQVKSSRIRDIRNNVAADSCQLNEETVDCSDVFAEEKDFDDNTLEGMLVAIITLTLVAIAVICFRNRNI